MARLLHECARVLAKMADEVGRCADAEHLLHLLTLVNLPVDTGKPPLPGELLDQRATDKKAPPQSTTTWRDRLPRTGPYDGGEAPDIMGLIAATKHSHADCVECDGEGVIEEDIGGRITRRACWRET